MCINEYIYRAGITVWFYNIVFTTIFYLVYCDIGYGI